MIAPFENARVLTGPTGSGKTQLALGLAEQLGAEIISMDSMALYRGMDIGTAKPTPAERRVPHHLIDVLDPWESSSVAWWLERAGDCCREIESRGRAVLFVGGTPLYLKALLRGLFEGPPADLALRDRLQHEADTQGPAALHARLAAVDPAAAARLHPNDLRRVIRALEVWEHTGQPISAQQTQWTDELRIADCGLRIESPEGPSKQGADAVGSESAIRNPQSAIPSILYLDLPRDELYARIDARVEVMFAAGLVEEVAALTRLPQPLSREAGQALGYKEVIEHLDGQVTLAETVARVQQRSRNFAKRQLTWFRSLPGCLAVKRELTFSAWGLTIG